ncbi:leucine dehydrogenase [Actinoplanes sp. SE50]|uniref:MFS transporter n=1 Tax=unclassified Actinoplanes TaxID=2626549 RepID=UPI00023EC2C4|nr:MULTISPECIES: MFS transporter [unclassified Actinoplanes]AEV85216.1 leucine dehydrogenase [Actinoplanes sp. SE50/110]ATO83611.1 leucine dehydrogenase [Actinoplanes sp. SE50]SLM01019.1 Leucine dehydrogenase [Actinoplanes sp. SE50/110]
MDHEYVVTRRGERSGLAVTIAVHATAHGRSAGGCRIKHYPDWRAGLADALRLSAAMTAKCAYAGLPLGGGKTVVTLPPGHRLDAAGRRDLLHDVGDLIEDLGGRYATGPDVGTGPDDMTVIHDRTRHVFCRPRSQGGSGDSSPHTAAGVVAALRAVGTHRFGTPELAGRRIAILGLGHVGAHLLRMLAAEGAVLTVADVDDSRRALADRHGATWTGPDDCLRAETDILVPAALGGVLTAATVPRLRCAAVAGPANNQLDDPRTADLLRERGILWAPDEVVSAGGPAGSALLSLGRAFPLLADAASFAVSALLVRSLPALHRPARQARESLLRQARSGASYVFRDRLLLGLALRPAIGNIAFVAAETVLALFAHDRLGLGTAGFGLLLTAEAAGGLLGAGLASPLRRTLGTGTALTCTAAIEGLAVLGLAAAPNPYAAGLALAVCGAGMGATMVLAPSLRQSIVPGHLLGRVTATSRMLAMCAAPLGAFLGGWLAAAFDVRTPLYVGGGLLLSMTLVTATMTGNRRVAAALRAATTVESHSGVRLADTAST